MSQSPASFLWESWLDKAWSSVLTFSVSLMWLTLLTRGFLPQILHLFTKTGLYCFISLFFLTKRPNTTAAFSTQDGGTASGRWRLWNLNLWPNVFRFISSLKTSCFSSLNLINRVQLLLRSHTVTNQGEAVVNSWTLSVINTNGRIGFHQLSFFWLQPIRNMKPARVFFSSHVLIVPLMCGGNAVILSSVSVTTAAWRGSKGGFRLIVPHFAAQTTDAGSCYANGPISRWNLDGVKNNKCIFKCSSKKPHIMSLG